MASEFEGCWSDVCTFRTLGAGLGAASLIRQWSGNGSSVAIDLGHKSGVGGPQCLQGKATTSTGGLLSYLRSLREWEVSQTVVEASRSRGFLWVSRLLQVATGGGPQTSQCSPSQPRTTARVPQLAGFCVLLEWVPGRGVLGLFSQVL